jgi:putative tryptophan/tyrosine transport system substrate-binding protein
LYYGHRRVGSLPFDVVETRMNAFKNVIGSAAVPCGTQVSRRVFLGGLAGFGVSAAGLALLNGGGRVAEAAQPDRMPVVAYIGEPPDEPWVKILVERLAELGWVDGQTINIQLYETPPSIADRSALFDELAAVPVDVLVTVGTPGTQAAMRATDTIPVVFESVSDPVGVGVVRSLERPGSNVTGVSSGMLTATFAGKQLELLKDIVPGLTRVAVLSGTENPAASAIASAELLTAADALGVQIEDIPVVSADELEDIFATASGRSVHAALIRTGPITIRARARIAELATQNQLPTIYRGAEFTAAGGLMSYGTSKDADYGRVGTYVDQVLRGVVPADLPVQVPTPVFAVNRNTLQALALSIPPHLAAEVTDWVA